MSLWTKSSTYHSHHTLAGSNFAAQVDCARNVKWVGMNVRVFVCVRIFIYIYIHIYNGSSSLETPEIHIIGARYSQFSDFLWMSKPSIAKFGNVLAIGWLETLSSSLAPHWIGSLQGVWIPRTRQIAPSVHHWIVYAIVNKVQHLS